MSLKLLEKKIKELSLSNRDPVPNEESYFEWIVKVYPTEPEELGKSLKKTHSCFSNIWTLELFPNGIANYNSDYIDLCICTKGYSTLHEFKIKVEIFDYCDSGVWLGPLHSAERAQKSFWDKPCWFLNFISREALFEKLRRKNKINSLILVCNITFLAKYGQNEDSNNATDESISKRGAELEDSNPTAPKQQPEFTLSECDSSWMKAIGAMYSSKEFSDVTLRVGGEEIPAHKVILSSRSKVFHAMLTNDMKEKQQNVIDLTEIDSIVAKELLQYMYTGKVNTLPFESTLELYAVADRYDLQELRDKCRLFLLKNLSVDNVCDVIAVGDLHSDETISETALRFFSNNTKDVLKSNKWTSLEEDKPQFCLKLLKNTTLSAAK